MTSSTESESASLLDREARALKERFVKDLNRQIFRDAPKSAPVTFSALAEYRDQINQNIYSATAISELLMKQVPKEDTVSTESIVAEVAAAKKKKRAEEIVEYLDGYFGSSDFDEGDTVSWSCRFKDGSKAYQYAAIKGDRFWYVTYDKSQYTTDELIAKIAVLAIDGDVVFGDDDGDVL